MKNKILFIVEIIFIFIILFSLTNISLAAENDEESHVYLSDISYMTDKSFAASEHSICIDKNDSSSLITLKVNDTSTPFIKGICAWATSEIVYDLSNYNYDYFTSYLGVDISEQSTYFNTGVKFYIYTSEDGENWTTQFESSSLYGWSEAVFVKVDIKGAKYLKLLADDNSNNWWANWYDEAVYANAKLVKEDYEEDTSNAEFIKTIDEYDEIIKEHYGEEIIGDYELTLLQREFVYNVGYDILQALARYSNDYKKTIEWLMTDKEVLTLYLAGGKPEGSYANSIKVLSDLYTTYKDDLENENKTEYDTKLSDLYRTMMLSLSLTQSGNVYLWIDGVNRSDAITRYEIYKKLHSESLIENKVFETLTVEEMRWVMNTIIDDEEILWLNDYVRNEKNGATSPYSYIKYTFGYNYYLDKYYDPENYDAWDEKYNLSKFDITYQKGQPKLWIVFEEGSVCGGLSKTGSCIWGSYKGLPNTCVSQPGHCAYIYYTQDGNGNGIWNLGNDVSGWGQSGRTEHLNVRNMNDWGSGSYTNGWNASYILLGQAAQNEYNKYENAEKILMLANVYSDDNEKLEEIYRKALEEEKINFDAWLGLVNLYISDDSKTEENYYKLAEEITEAYTYYPKPMYDLLNLIKTKMTSAEYQTILSLLETRTLTTATQTTATESIQANAVKQVAKALLGNIDTTIADFSFDGDNAGSIVLSSRFDGMDVAWDFSLDGGNTWTLSEEHILPLSEEQINSITADLDIRVHIMGVDYSEDNIFIIDIKDSEGLPTTLYANDLENKMIGATTAMEWKFDENDAWTSYNIAEPDLTGDKTVIVRMGRTGVYLESNSETYSFTEDNQPDTRKYISISHLSIESVSSEEPSRSGAATMAIDGNINTRWITNWSGQDTNRYITIKLDEPVYLSALEYVPIQGKLTNGVFKDVVLSVSLDGENWTEVANITGWAANANSKTIELEEAVQTQYVRLDLPVNYSQSGGTANFASATMINLFEDITNKTVPTAEIEYSTTELTNQDVTVKLINPSTNITITNNDGKDTYIFEENGEFTFEFENGAGVAGTATAIVTWIDKEVPTASIEYDITEPTNQDVIATIGNFSEEVTILNNNGDNTYTFTENGSFEFIYQDKAGNEGRTTAIVDWIDKEVPEATIEYSTTEETSGNVIVTIKCDEEIIITNNEGKTTYVFEENGEFTFEYEDKLGNKGTIVATVDWINKEAPLAYIEYDITELTNKDVIATIKCNEEIIVTNNEGKTTYVFEENGEFTFEYEDMLGNKATITAKVSWIDKEAPEATIEYSTTEETSEEVIATIKCDEEIIILNNDGKETYTFKENGSFEFVYQDKLGNEGKAVATVNWIVPKKDDNDNTVNNNTVNNNTVNDNTMNNNTANNTVNDNTMNNNTENNNTASDNTVNNNTVNSNTASDNTVNNNTVNSNTASDNTVNNNTVNSNTASDNTVNNNIVSNNTASNNTVNDNAENNNTANNNTVNNTTNNIVNTISLSNNNTSNSNSSTNTKNETVVIGNVTNSETSSLNTGDTISIIAFSVMIIATIANIIQIIVEKKQNKD